MPQTIRLLPPWSWQDLQWLTVFHTNYSVTNNTLSLKSSLKYLPWILKGQQRSIYLQLHQTRRSRKRWEGIIDVCKNKNKITSISSPRWHQSLAPYLPSFLLQSPKEVLRCVFQASEPFDKWSEGPGKLERESCTSVGRGSQRGVKQIKPYPPESCLLGKQRVTPTCIKASGDSSISFLPGSKV